MQLFKFKIFICTLLCTSIVYAFTDSECMNINFDEKVEYDSNLFGLIPEQLQISKNNCELLVEHTKWFFIKNIWKVDFCRGPVHFKFGPAQDLILRENGCLANTSDKKELKTRDYCVKLETLEQVITQSGLIHAIGEKENLASVHGKFFCSYLLVRAYLKKGLVLSRSAQYKDILESDSLNIFN